MKYIVNRVPLLLVDTRLLAESKAIHVCESKSYYSSWRVSHLPVGKPVPPDGKRQFGKRKPGWMDPEGIRPNPMRTGNRDIFVNMFLCAY